MSTRAAGPADQTTSDPATDRLARGASIAWKAGAWLAPAVVPAVVIQTVFVALPWMDSAEARSQEASISWAADRSTRAALLDAVAAIGGVAHLVAVGALLTLAWIVVLRWFGPFRRSGLAPRPSRSHALHAIELLAWLAGAGSCLLVRASASRLDLLVDAVTSLRPSSAASLALIAVSQGFLLGACAAILGAALEAARLARFPRARLGAFAVLATLALGASLVQVAARIALASRFDVGRTLESALGATAEPRRVYLGVLARDRTWLLPVRDGLGSVRYGPESAARAEALLQRRGGWSMLAADAERFVVGERLIALDPDAARASALRCVLRHGSMSQALLVSLGSAAPGAEARRVLASMETSPSLVFGRDALYLAAHAHARLGDADRARDALAKLRSRDGIAWIQQRHAAKPLVLTTSARGSVTGRLVVDDAPYRGRVALVSTRDLFSFPGMGGDLPVTWLLRMVTATECDADGRFVLAGLPDDEMALVVLLRARLSPRREPLPPIVVTEDAPDVALGDIRLLTAR